MKGPSGSEPRASLTSKNTPCPAKDAPVTNRLGPFREPKAPSFSPRGGLDGVIDSLLFAQHALEMFRRSLPNGAPKERLDQLTNRLTKILAETRKLKPTG